MKNINLGKVKVPLDQYASQGNAVLGIRGSGKTYTGTGIAEQLLDGGVPITVLDPVGVWRFLRVPSKEGGKAYPVVVAGGQHADIPLPVHGAGEVMRAAMRDGVSIVFDLYDVGLSKADWRRVVSAVVKVLLYENKEHGLRHVFIEEAAEFVPQKISDGFGEVYSIVERLARMGGNAQLGLTLINQRAEEVNKAVLELCDLLLLHRQKGRRSLENLSHWLDLAAGPIAKDVAATVPGLANGECYVWPEGAGAPTRTLIPAKHTFHPDRRAMKQAVIAEARRVDVGKFAESMKDRLASIIKEAEAKDPTKLQAEIRRLNAELAKKPAAAAPLVDQVAIAAARQEGREEGARDGYAAGLRAVQPLAERLGTLSAAVSETVEGFQADLKRLLAQAGKNAVAFPTSRARAERVGREHVASMTAARPAQALQRAPAAPVEGAVDKPMPRAMLTALAQHPDGLTKGQVLVHTGYRSSGPVSACFAELARAGWMESVNGGKVRITSGGIAALGHYDPLPTGAALREHLLNGNKLSGMEKAMLRVLFDTYPEPIAKGTILERTGYASSGPTSAAFARLVALGYAEQRERGHLRAADEFFNA